LEVIEAIDGPLNADSNLADVLSAKSHDKLQNALSTVTATAREQLEAIKLSQLLEMPPDRKR
jgi:DNA-binding IscR family transcriptional regulator